MTYTREEAQEAASKLVELTIKTKDNNENLNKNIPAILNMPTIARTPSISNIERPF